MFLSGVNQNASQTKIDLCNQLNKIVTQKDTSENDNSVFINFIGSKQFKQQSFKRLISDLQIFKNVNNIVKIKQIKVSSQKAKLESFSNSFTSNLSEIIQVDYSILLKQETLKIFKIFINHSQKGKQIIDLCDSSQNFSNDISRIQPYMILIEQENGNDKKQDLIQALTKIVKKDAKKCSKKRSLYNMTAIKSVKSRPSTWK